MTTPFYTDVINPLEKNPKLELMEISSLKLIFCGFPLFAISSATLGLNGVERFGGWDGDAAPRQNRQR